MPLLTINTLPPGQWRYEQKAPDGRVFRKFHGSGPFLDFCKTILSCRVGNSFPRATIDEVILDANNAQCERLGNDPRFCAEGSGPVVILQGPVAPAGGGCGTCGGKKA
jgi:hypothetical protein